MYHRRKFVPMSCGSVRNKLLCLRVQRNLKFSLSGCWVANGWNPCSRSRRCGDRSMAFFLKHTSKHWEDHCRKVEDTSQVPRNRAHSVTQSTNSTTKTTRHGNWEVDELCLVGHVDWEVDELCLVGHVVTSAKPFQFEARWYIFEHNEAVIKIDPKGQKSYDETRVQNPQSCVGFCCLIGSTWTPKSKSNTLTPKTNSLTCRLKVTSPVMSGVILLVCSTSWILRCFLPATFFQWINAIPCRRGRCRKENQEKELVLAKIEGSEVGIMNNERESISHAGFGYIIQPEELCHELEFWSHTHRVIMEKQERKSVASKWEPSSKHREPEARFESALKYAEIVARSAESTHRDKFGPCHSSDLQQTVSGESLHIETSASSSQVWHRDVEPIPSTERSGREMNQRSGTGRPEREVQKQLAKAKLNHHNLEISNTRYTENVFATVRPKLNRPEDDQTVLGQKVNVKIWRLLMSTTKTASETPTSRRPRRCSTSRSRWSWTRSTRPSTSPRLNSKLLPRWDLLCNMTK